MHLLWFLYLTSHLVFGFVADYGFSSIWYPSDPEWVHELNARSKSSLDLKPPYYHYPSQNYLQHFYDDQLEWADTSNQERFLFQHTTTTTQAPRTTSHKLRASTVSRATPTVRTTVKPAQQQRPTPGGFPPPQGMPPTMTTTTPPSLQTTKMPTTSKPTMSSTNPALATTTTTTTSTPLTLSPKTTTMATGTLMNTTIPTPQITSESKIEDIFVDPDNCSIVFYFGSGASIRHFRAWTPGLQNTPSVCVWTFYSSSPSAQQRFVLQPRCNSTAMNQLPDGRLLSMNTAGELQSQSSLCSAGNTMFESRVALLSLFLSSTNSPPMGSRRNTNFFFRQATPFQMAFEILVTSEDGDLHPGYYY